MMQSLVENPAKTNVCSLHVVLVNPEIPWNTGNVGRTCLATNTQLHLVRPLGYAITASELKRAGLDYWDRVNPIIWNDWLACEQHLPEYGEPYFFSAEASVDLWNVRFPERCVLVFGRESVGLPDEIRSQYVSRLVRIPMSEGVARSLNLSTAVAVAIFETLRQRQVAANFT